MKVLGNPCKSILLPGSICTTHVIVYNSSQHRRHYISNLKQWCTTVTACHHSKSPKNENVVMRILQVQIQSELRTLTLTCWCTSNILLWPQIRHACVFEGQLHARTTDICAQSTAWQKLSHTDLRKDLFWQYCYFKTSIPLFCCGYTICS